MFLLFPFIIAAVSQMIGKAASYGHLSGFVLVLALVPCFGLPIILGRHVGIRMPPFSSRFSQGLLFADDTPFLELA